MLNNSIYYYMYGNETLFQRYGESEVESLDLSTKLIKINKKMAKTSNQVGKQKQKEAKTNMTEINTILLVLECD